MSIQKIFKKHSEEQLNNIINIKEHFEKSVIKFLSQNEIKLLVLPHSWTQQLAVMKIERTLKNLKGELGALYGIPEVYMFIRWSGLLELLNDPNPKVPQLPNILVIELDENSEGMDYLTSIIKSVCSCDKKKIVLAWSNIVKESFDAFLNIFNTAMIYKMDSLGDISAKDIAKTKKDLENENWFDAVMSDDVEKMKNLCEKNVNIVNETEINTQNTALHIAVNRGNQEMVKMLLLRHAKHVPNGKNMAPLHYAVKKENPLVLKALLDNTGVDKNMKGGRQEYTPLHYAAFTNNVKAISLLAEYDADLNPRSMNGFTPFQAACYKCNIGSVKKLLCYKGRLDINAKTNNQSRDTALHTAVRKNNLNIIEILIDNGADTSIKNARQITPLQQAEIVENYEALRIFNKKRVKRDF